MKRCFKIIILLSSLTIFYPLYAKQPETRIEKLIEVRGGNTSVWGIRMELGKYSIRKNIALSEVRVIEAKHSRDISKLMEIFTNDDRNILIIRFKPGMGDFGSGNSVKITIPKKLIKKTTELPSDGLVFYLGTDISSTNP